jgi:hypothetical protein
LNQGKYTSTTQHGHAVAPVSQNDDDSKAVFALAETPFPREPPRQIRAVLWQYRFTTMAEKHATGMWWRRQLLGLHADAGARIPG